MIFPERAHQYSYYAGYVSKTKRTQLDEAYQRFSEIFGRKPEIADIFDPCPFNDRLEQIVRGFQIYEKTKKDELVNLLETQMSEFFYLVSDFTVPNSGDGRAFFAKAHNGQIVLQCDRSFQCFALDGSPFDVGEVSLMTKNDFAQRFGDLSPTDWPYRGKLTVATEC
ncbi:hypothetical protein [Yoonia sp. R2-816]|uniref:hypothetical protein n=1 Tax=Yoonia sp. R2-816 TaxID=3342638 RepID=UPI003727620D